MNQLIIYKKPSPLTASELAILKHGNLREKHAVIAGLNIRALGVPSKIVLGDRVDSNYSSAVMDWKKWNSQS